MKKVDDELLLFGPGIEHEVVFDSLYNSYWESLYVYIVRLVGDETEAEDIVQDVFITIWHLRGNLSHVKSLKAYLFTIARNRGLKYLVEIGNKKSCSVSLLEFIQAEEHGIEDNLIAKDLSDFLATEVNKLPERMQEVFKLSRQEHLTHTEIASRLEISDQTVKKQINNSLRSLRIKLKNNISLLLIFFK